MPPTRAAVGRAAKLDEILDRAQARLCAGGYDQMSIAAIARELGVSQNTIYWYYPSKDDLFAAVARRVLEIHVASKPSGRGELAKILWTAEKMSELGPLRGEINARAPHCPAVDALRTQLEDWTDTLLTSGIRQIAHPDSQVAAIAFRASVEGAVSLGLSRRARREVISWAFAATVAALGGKPSEGT